VVVHHRVIVKADRRFNVSPANWRERNGKHCEHHHL
jgi:hypothetical protein